MQNALWGLTEWKSSCRGELRRATVTSSRVCLGSCCLSSFSCGRKEADLRQTTVEEHVRQAHCVLTGMRTFSSRYHIFFYCQGFRYVIGFLKFVPWSQREGHIFQGLCLVKLTDFWMTVLYDTKIPLLETGVTSINNWNVSWRVIWNQCPKLPLKWIH